MKWIVGRVMLTSMSLFTFCGIVVAQNTVTVPEEVVAYPDLVIYNAKLVTMDDTSFGLNTPIGTVAEAVAIRGGKILAIGTNDRIVRLAGPKTDKIDVQRRMVMPGIIDTHTHIHNNEMTYWLSQNPAAVREISSEYAISGKTDAELETAITLVVQDHVRKTGPGRWGFVTIAASGSGEGLGVAYLRNKKFTKQMLDKLSPNHPVMLSSHPSYIINSAAITSIEKLYGSKVSLEAAGIDEFGRLQATAPQYGRGLVVDQYFNTRVPQLADIVEQGLAKNAAVGITTYGSNIMGQRFLDAFNLLARQGRMPIRFAYTHWFGFAAGYPESASFYRRMGDMAGMGTDYFWQMAVGLGSIDSGPPRVCSTMEGPKVLKEMDWCQNVPGTTIYEATRAGIANYVRVVVGHAYADKGVDYYMDAVEQAMRDNPAITLDYIRSRRLSSDHCGFYPRKEHIPRLAKLGMIISCGGNVLSRSYPWIGPGRFAPEYINRIAPVRSAIAGGVMVTVENEAGVLGNTSASYFRDAAAFLTRKNEQGALVAPEEAVDRATLMKMMTSWASRYVLKEDVLGTLEPGKFADLLVLNQDYFTVPVEQIPQTFPLMTVVGGKIVSLREEFAKELGRAAIGPQIEYRNELRYGSRE